MGSEKANNCVKSFNNNPEIKTLFCPQAKNEQDPLAIAALNKSLSLDPKNLEAILALAASLTNESNQAHACYALKGTIRGLL